MPKLPPPPHVRLQVIEDLSPTAADGFLKLKRHRLVAHYPDGTTSEPFVYDQVDRRALDAVVIAAHGMQGGRRVVYLRSAIRPPCALRDSSRSPIAEQENRGLWELPAGLVEAGEETEAGLKEAARRELQEEAGFDIAVDQFHALGPSTFPTAGVIGERHFFFHVEVVPDERGEPDLDGSALEAGGEVLAVPLAEALELCRAGAFEDAKTELGLRRLEDVLR